MKYTTLGATDIRISRIVMGCWALGGGYTWGDQDDGQSMRTVHAALDQGINGFDTAEFYGGGRSEEVLGRALEGRRAEAVVSGKVWVANMSRDKLAGACEATLRRLRTDYLDLYMIHWPNPKIPLEETLAAMEALLRSGKVRAIGVCNFGVRDLAEAVLRVDVAANQLPYNLLFRAIEHEVLESCREHEVGVFAYSALAQGLLTGKFRGTGDVDDERARIRFYSRNRPGTVHDEDGCEAEVFAAVDRIRAISAELGRTMAQVAVAWILQQPGVSGVVVGARRPDQVDSNAPAADLRLDGRDLERLDAATREVKDRMGPNPDMWRTESRFR